MMTNRKSTLAAILLAAALALVLAMMTALACGPAATPTPPAPPTQDTPPPATRPAPPTQAIPAPAAEEPSATATPEAGAANDRNLLDGFLRARLAEYEAAQSRAQSASGPAATPQIVSINIASKTGAGRQDVIALLAERGATNIHTSGSTQIFADIPASLLSTLATRADINRMKATAFPYPGLPPDANGMAVMYEAGLTPSEDTDPTYARMVILIKGDDNYDSVKRFLVAGGAVMTFGDVITEDAYKPRGMLVAFVPVKLFAELDGQPGVYNSHFEAYPVPELLRRTQYARATPTPTPMLTPTLTPTPSPSRAQEYACRVSQSTPPQLTPGLPPGPQPTPPPPAPQNEPGRLSAVFADGAVVLCWTPGSDPNYVRQVVKRREQGVHPEAWTRFTLNAATDAYADATALPGKTYIYRVEGLRQNGAAGVSDQVAITVP